MDEMPCWTPAEGYGWDMRMRSVSLIFLLGCLWGAPLWRLQAEEVSGQPSPFSAPPEMIDYIRRTVIQSHSLQSSLQAILSHTFLPTEQGGLGIHYDNGHTRTVQEVWAERRANCLSLTAFYVEACTAVGLKARYAEAINTNRWTRRNGQIRLERHVVALVEGGVNGDLVADFLPQARRRMGVYAVTILSPKRFLALFYANRAVEIMEAGDLVKAESLCGLAMESDPQLSAVWNTRGVLRLHQDRMIDAEQDFKSALNLEKRDFIALGNLENLCRLQGREAESARYREMSLKLRQKDPYFQSFLAEESLLAGNHQEALRQIRAAIKINPQDPEFYVIKARIEMDKGELDAAAKSIKEAQKYASPEERARFENKAESLKRLQQGQGQ